MGRNPSDSDAAAARARVSRGTSDRAIYQMVVRNVLDRHRGGGTLVDVGCGIGSLWRFLSGSFESYLGIDVVRYEDFPTFLELRMADLDAAALPCEDDFADVVVAVETIEHLENPRHLARELIRIVKPGGWVLISTPNQESALSLLTLLAKRRFNAFQDAHYPTHLSALLEIDLRRMALECGLTEIAVDYTRSGRIPGTRLQMPRIISAASPRLCSDNMMLIGRRPPC